MNIRKLAGYFGAAVTTATSTAAFGGTAGLMVGILAYAMSGDAYAGQLAFYMSSFSAAAWFGFNRAEGVAKTTYRLVSGDRPSIEQPTPSPAST